MIDENMMKASNANFTSLLIMAKKGDKEAQHILLAICEPLVHKYSKVNGFIDPDLAQRLRLEWFVALKKFELIRCLPMLIDEVDPL